MCETARFASRARGSAIGRNVVKVHLLLGLTAIWLLASAVAVARPLGCKDFSTQAPDSQTDGRTDPQTATKKGDKDQSLTPKLPDGVPAKVGIVLQYIERHRRAP